MLHDVDVVVQGGVAVALGPAVGGHGVGPALGRQHGDLVAVGQLGLGGAGGGRGPLGVVELGAGRGGAPQVLHGGGGGVGVALLLAGRGQALQRLVRHVGARPVVVRVRGVVLVVGVGRLRQDLAQGLGRHVGWHRLLRHCNHRMEKLQRWTSHTPPQKQNCNGGFL